MQRPAQLPERDEALGALAMLRSVARTGVTYQEYAPRLSEAQVAVDRYLQAEDGAPAIKGAIADEGLAPLWSCASHRLASAERLREGKQR